MGSTLFNGYRQPKWKVGAETTREGCLPGILTSRAPRLSLATETETGMCDSIGIESKYVTGFHTNSKRSKVQFSRPLNKAVRAVQWISISSLPWGIRSRRVVWPSPFTRDTHCPSRTLPEEPSLPYSCSSYLRLTMDYFTASGVRLAAQRIPAPTPPPTIAGQRAYCAGNGVVHPKDSMPVRVRLRQP